jgi:hypothetical protein
MTDTVYVIKVFQGLQIVKQYVEKARDIADMVAGGIESLGYDVAVEEVQINV